MLGLRQAVSGNQVLHCGLPETNLPVPGPHSTRRELNSPVQQGVVQVLTKALQDLVVVPDGRGLVLTCCKVTLQLKGRRQS